MKIIVTHSSPDLDAIASVWLLKRFLQGWENAEVKFVPAGERFGVVPRAVQRGSATKADNSEKLDYKTQVVELINDDEIIHVDTGFGPFDHHDTDNDTISAASLVWEYIKKYQISRLQSPEATADGGQANSKYQISERMEDKNRAIDRMVKVIVDADHFKDVFWENPLADYHEFSVIGILDGLKLQKQNQDQFYIDFISECLDAILHNFENRIWAEREIKENGVEFNTRFGKGMGFETINDDVIKLAQRMDYVIVLRKDPRKGYIRIKARPTKVESGKLPASPRGEKVENDIDLTLVYEKLKKMDPDATWFLHVSKKMLLNGSVKNPKMRPTKLSLSDIIRVLCSV